MLGLVVLLVVVESCWQLQQVQAVVRLFIGPRVCELMGVGLDELVLGTDSGAQVSPEQPQYKLPIATISHPVNAAQTSPSVEETFTLGAPRGANCEKTVHPDQNN